MISSNSISDYSAIIMDLSMPVMDGIAATKHIREVLKKTCPIICMTSVLRNDFKTSVDPDITPPTVDAMKDLRRSRDEGLQLLSTYVLTNGANYALMKPTNTADVREAFLKTGLLNEDGRDFLSPTPPCSLSDKHICLEPDSFGPRHNPLRASASLYNVTIEKVVGVCDADWSLHSTPPSPIVADLLRMK